MVQYIQAHGKELWAAIATCLWAIGELLTWNDKAKSNSFTQLLWNLIVKGAGKDAPPAP